MRIIKCYHSISLDVRVVVGDYCFLFFRTLYFHKFL